MSRGKHGLLSLEGLDQGEHAVRLVAEGYEPVETSVIVLPGEKAVIQRTLERKPMEQAPAPQPQRANPRPLPATGPPSVYFRTTPSGATVSVDGNVVGTTPVRWNGGKAGKSYRVTLSLPGYLPVQDTLDGLRTGRRTSFSRTLEQAKDPGTLKVVIVGGGWANVYVDGKKQKKTAPLSLELLPGSYQVRVANEATGIDHTETVTILPGQSTAVQARP